MDLQQLGTPSQVWRRWVMLAAGHAAAGRPGFEVRRGDGLGLAEQGKAWLRLRRLGGNRAVLWAHHDELPVDDGFVDELRDEAPDWSYDVDSAYATRQVGFLGWHAHGSWSSVPAPVPSAIAELLAPLRCDADLEQWWRTQWPTADQARLRDVLGDVTADPDGDALRELVGADAAHRARRQIRLGATWSQRQLSEAATVHLRGQIHAQMRAGRELDDRGHPRRPPLLRQWAAVHATGAPFSHAVSALGPSSAPALVPSHGNHGLNQVQARALDNVVMELRMSETDETSGAWLFARVTGSGRTVSMERRYDTWPSWYDAATGPTMTALHAEMVQRAPRWRPSWASLLPVDRF